MPCSVSQPGGTRRRPAGHHNGASFCVTAAGQAGAPGADQQPAIDHGLAGVGSVIDPRELRDRGDGAARLVGGESAELDGRDHPVARGPGALTTFHAGCVIGDDEALVVSRQAIEAWAEQSWYGKYPLRGELLIAGLEHQARPMTTVTLTSSCPIACAFAERSSARSS